MKTLDEVIAELEDEGVFADALQYLRAYRDDKDDLTALRAYWKEQHENNALTWDELRTMEGKPVWVECWLGKRWGLIEKIDNVDGVENAYCIVSHGHRWNMYAEDTGKTWQVYRKERS